MTKKEKILRLSGDVLIKLLAELDDTLSFSDTESHKHIYAVGKALSSVNDTIEVVRKGTIYE